MRHWQSVVLLGIVFLSHLLWWAWLRESRAVRARAWLGRALPVLAGASFLWIASGLIFGIGRFVYLLPGSPFWSWFRGASLSWGILSLILLAAYATVRHVPPFRQDRRDALRLVKGAVMASPVAVTGFAMAVSRAKVSLEEVEVRVPGLPKDLDGLRLVQLSDIHLSPFLSEREFARAVDMANETKAQVALVTGDLITRAGDPLEACLNQLGRLKADAGVYGCMGNHEIYARSVRETGEGAARRGIPFLRMAVAKLRFGNAWLNLAGVDYQYFGEPYLVGAERLRDPAAFNLLLSHNPDVFPVAARQGFDLVLAGHTHGGQVTVEYLHQWLNVARFYTPFVSGLYRQQKAAMYVSRGIGTVGLPARIGAPAEVSLIKLCAG